MEFSNLISTSISEKVVDEIIQSIDNIDKKLPGLLTLSSEQKDALPHMGEDMEPFLFMVLQKAKKNPDMIPPGIDLEEIQKDVDLIQATNRILEPLRKLVQKLEDSALLAGSEAYVPSLFLYNVMKNASRFPKKNTKAVFTHHKNLLRKDVKEQVVEVENIA
jgi:hypothetical protein